MGMFHFCHGLKAASGTMYFPQRSSVLLQPEKSSQDGVSDVNNDQPLVGRIYGYGDKMGETKGNCDMKEDWQQL